MVLEKKLENFVEERKSKKEKIEQIMEELEEKVEAGNRNDCDDTQQIPEPGSVVKGGEREPNWEP